MKTFDSVPDDHGPWQVDVWSDRRVVLQSHDGTHDVALEINGDFSCLEQRLEYANKLVKRLNEMLGVEPLDWRKRDR